MKTDLKALERRAQRCTTHHHGCDCRELAHAKQVEALQAENKDLKEKYKEVWDSSGELNDRNHELLQDLEALTTKVDHLREQLREAWGELRRDALATRAWLGMVKELADCKGRLELWRELAHRKQELELIPDSDSREAWEVHAEIDMCITQLKVKGEL